MKEIVDLSLALENGITPFPLGRHPAFESSVVASIAEHGREIRRFTMGSHTATHIDAMRHFLPGGRAIEQIPLSTLVGPASLIHLDGLKPHAVIDVAELRPRVENGPVDRLLIRTDWSRFWGTPQYYEGWPSLTDAATRYLIRLGIQLLGLDFPSPDLPYFGNDCSLDSPNHKLLFAHDVVLVEYLTNLSALPEGRLHLMVMPLKLTGFDGAPARVAAYPLDPLRQ